MLYKIITTGQKAEIEFNGRLTYSDYSLFKQITDIIGESTNQECIFNLSALEFIDSAGLGMLLLARDKIQECRGNITLLNPSGQVKKMIELGRFDALFKIIIDHQTH
jgi:anti-anti-sigma factor